MIIDKPNPTVLLVEDDDGVRYLIRRRLRSAGCTVIAVSAGRDALEQYTDEVDLLVTDHVLPDMVGTELVDELAHQHRLPPFIVTTGHGDERLAVEMLKRGARDYVTKDMAFPGSLVESVRRNWRELQVEARLRAAEQAASELERDLMETQRHEAIGRLAGGVAHSFNNILFVIMAEAELAQLGDHDEATSAALQAIHDGAVRGREVTRQLLALSRQQVLELRPIDVHRALTLMQPLLARTVGPNIQVDLFLNARKCVIQADLAQFEEAMTNLSVGARDTMPDGGRLIISTADLFGADAGHRLRIRFEDTGAGVSPEIRERMFEPFVTSKDRRKAGGLGLATVRGIVGQHGGTIEVESEEGVGTRFVMAFPITDELPINHTPTGEHPGAMPGGTETILLVEDETQIRRALTTTFEKLGYRVLAAPSGDDAVRYCARYAGPIHLLLSDVVMPGTNGYDAAIQIRQAQQDIKVLFMSGFVGDEVLAVRDIRKDGFELVAKPIELRRLAQRVRSLLDE